MYVIKAKLDIINDILEIINYSDNNIDKIIKNINILKENIKNQKTVRQIFIEEHKILFDNNYKETRLFYQNSAKGIFFKENYKKYKSYDNKKIYDILSKEWYKKNIIVKDDNIKNSGYYRCFEEKENDIIAEDIAILLRTCHSLVIKNGNDLDTNILQNNIINKNDIKKYKKIECKNINNYIGHYLKYKIYKKDLKILTKNWIELDYVIINNNNINIFEIKDGSVFDTKKSQIEIETLMLAKQYFQKIFENIEISYYMVFWNADNIINNGFKTKLLNEKNQLTGREFCKILNIDFDKINNYRKINNGDKKLWFLKYINNLLQLNDFYL